MQTESERRQFSIMAVDDSALVLQAITRALSGYYKVYTYNSVPNAIQSITKLMPDIILLDYEMPSMNGFELLEWIKANKSLDKTPVIFLTAYQDIQFELKAFSLGAVDYIHKPFTPQLLIKRIQVHLSHAQMQSRLEAYNNDLRAAVEEKTMIIRELQNAIIFTLADLIEMRDHATGGHVQRTTAYYKIILDKLRSKGIYSKQLNEQDDKLLLEAVQLHDIGKVSIPDNILLKPGKLTENEYEQMKAHAEIGYTALLKAMKHTHSKKLLNLAAIVALTHHERWDGTGYPNKLSGEAIPVVGRIMAVVDAYDAIVSERPYKKALSHEEAICEIIKGRATQFDPVLVDLVVAEQALFQQANIN